MPIQTKTGKIVITTARQAETVPPGKYSTNVRRLFLRVRGGSRAWFLRYKVNGKTKELSLGSLPTTTFKQATAKAHEAAVLLSEGADPGEKWLPPAPEATEPEPTTPTFTQAAAAFIRINRHGWSNRKPARQWTATLKTYARPVVGKKAVDEITTEDVLKILQPIWIAKTETAKRVQGRIENVLDFAAARQWRDPSNPARWRGHLDKLLPKPTKVKTVRPQPALPYEDVPNFILELGRLSSVSSKALEFLILTACRTMEVLGAQWQEIDIQARTWTIPAARMKGRREHRVPLSDPALQIVKTMPRLDDSRYVFPGARPGRPLSNMALLQVMRGMGYGAGGERGDAVPHGFRSSFRDWAGGVSSFPNHVCEMALAHVISNKAEAAYRRRDLFDKRRAMMQQWADWCFLKASDSVASEPTLTGTVTETVADVLPQPELRNPSTLRT